MNLLECFKILGIEPQTDLNLIKQAYKSQVRRWHPDQFPADSTVKASAEEQLKQINIAYARIKTHLALHSPSVSKTSTCKPSQPPPQTPKAKGSNPSKRSWIDHLFETLNAFTGGRNAPPQHPETDAVKAKQQKTFEQVLSEIIGENIASPTRSDHTGNPPRKRVRPSDYQKAKYDYGSAASSDNGNRRVEPVKPVERVQRIGKRG